jgi:tRNA dimethylallyltransferase
MIRRAAGGGPRFLAVVGPTAVGKTALSLALAEHLPIEIVSMDSRQVYRDMDIGTDKVSAEERARVPHHGLDLVAPSERFSAGRFAREARAWMDGIETRGRVPVLVGGTGFFLRALMDPIFEEPRLDEDRLGRLRPWLAARDREELARWVEVLDPERAAVAIEGGPQRMSRTLEVALLTGRPLSRWHREAPAQTEGTDGLVVVLELPRDELRRRIDQRVSRMVERGLVDEVRRLVAAGFTETDPGMSGTGYREIITHLKGERSLEEAVEDVRVATRRYARRQTTWFRHQLPGSAVRIDATLPLEERAGRVLAAWAERGGAGAPPFGAGPGDAR